jgi:hypothetical protein
LRIVGKRCGHNKTEEVYSMEIIKKMFKRRLALCQILQLYLIFALSCTSISLYSEVAYEQATSLKVESLALMDSATEDYAIQQASVEDLETKLDKAYEYAKGRPKNEISAKQWQILIDPERNLLGGFLKRWELEGALSGVFIEEAKGLISDAFDTIIGLESGKIKPEGLNNE